MALINKNYFNLKNLVNFIICFLPISFLLGSLIVNLNILTLLIVGFSLVISQNLKLNLNKTEYLLILFFVLYILSTILNYEVIGKIFLIKSFLSLRFLFMYLLFKVLLENNKIQLDFFFKICLICTSFLSIDVFVQFFYGKDIFGIPAWDGRVAGLLSPEGIAGGYIQRLFLFSFLGLISFLDKVKNKNLFIFFFIFLHLNATLVTNNRISLLFLVFTIFVLILFCTNLRKILIISTITLSLSFTFLINSHKEIGHHLKTFQLNVINVDVQKKSSNEAEKKLEIKNTFFNSTHGRLFKSVFTSFTNNIYIGHGYKSYRLICSENCSSHPHNYHLEILHDTGAVGYTLMFIFVSLILFKKVKKIVRRNSSKIPLNYIFYFTLLNFLIEIFPIRSSGGLFSTWNGTFTWVIIAMSLYEVVKKKNNFLNVRH